MTRGRAAPRRRRPGLRRLRTARDAVPARRRGPRQPRSSSGPRPTARRSRSTSGPPTSDLLVYVNINLVAMDGGWKSTATGLASYRSLRHHHNPTTMEASHSFMDQHRSELHKSNWRMGKVMLDSRRQGLPDRDDAQHRHVPEAVRVPVQARVGVDAEGPGDLPRRPPSRWPLAPTRLARKIFHSIEAPHQMTSIQAGEVEAVHKPHDRERLPPAARRGAGPDRHPHDGHPVHLPLQRATRS